MTASRRAVLAAALVALAAALPAASRADSFTPVRLSIQVSATARRAVPLRVTVGVSADPGVLDPRDGAIRIGVKLAGECGGDFASTPGDVLLDQALRPQPATGRAYAATATGAGRPTAYGEQTVCVFLQDSGAQRVFANDESLTVDVSRACTVAAARDDAAVRRVAATQRALRRAHGARARRLRRRLATERAVARRDRTAARGACGPGVAL